MERMARGASIVTGNCSDLKSLNVVVVKKKGSLSSRAFVEIASTKRGIANFELGVKIKKKVTRHCDFLKKGTIAANTADDKFPPYFHRVSRSSISNMESRDAPLSPHFSRYT